MNLVTWNVNRFDGTWDWHRNGCDIEEKERKKYLELIIKKIKKYVKEENDGEYPKVCVNLQTDVR